LQKFRNSSGFSHITVIQADKAGNGLEYYPQLNQVKDCNAGRDGYSPANHNFGGMTAKSNQIYRGK
jgi:hypothetical protein